MQAVKAGKLEDRYENALVELLNQEAQARAGTNGRETARCRQRRQPDGCAGKSLNDVGKGGASQPAKGRKAKKAASGQRGMLMAISGKAERLEWAKSKGAKGDDASDPMRSDAVVAMGAKFQNPTQMRLAQNDDVTQTLAPDRSDQPFDNADPGRG